MSETAITKMSDEMLDRQVEWWFQKTPSILDTINKVYIYNPNYQKWEEMDLEKKWKFKVKLAHTWDELIIDPFEFWLIDVCKVTSWEVTYKDEYWMSIFNSKQEPAKDYYYSNEYFPMMAWNNVVAFRKMKWSKESAIYLRKKDLSQILRLPKINWKQNDFSVIKEKQDKSTYRTSSITESHVIYWKFLSWPLTWEYFLFYPKDNMIWFNYSKWEYVEPLDWTLTRIMQDALVTWNQVRKENWREEIRNLPYSLIDLKMYTESKDVMNKEFNVWKFEFKRFTWTVRDNLEDIQYIKTLRDTLFSERFDWMKQPMKVIFIDKAWKEYDDYPADKTITIVDCKFEHDFSYVEDTKALWSWEQEEITEAEVEQVFDNPKAEAVHKAAVKGKAPF